MSDFKTEIDLTDKVKNIEDKTMPTKVVGDNDISIIRFTPWFRTVRWGGRRIAGFKGIDIPTDRVGESWEVSPLEGMETPVESGPFAGMSPRELLQSHGREIMGEKLSERYGNNFPLLIKFIDAEDDLSIQVHPDDAESDGNGKTELWYIIDAIPGSHIYSGLNCTLTPEQMRRRLTSRTLADVLAKHYPEPGDVFYIPAGRVHSAGAGNFVLEIQQPSDITYRLWDWDRRDTNGQLRELHIESALKAVDFSQTDYGLARPQLIPDRETIIKRTPFFTVTAMNVATRVKLPIASLQSFRVLVAVEGGGDVIDPHGRAFKIKQGQTLLVPAQLEYVNIIHTSESPLKLITVYVE